MSARARERQNEPVVQLGDIVFTSAEVRVVRNDKAAQAVPRAAISSIKIESGASAVDPRRTAIWGYGSIWASVMSVFVPWTKGLDQSGGSLAFSAALLAFGVLLIASSRPRTLVHLNGDKRITLRTRDALSPAEVGALCQELRDELGYKVSS